jgi:hypothetical protein
MSSRSRQGSIRVRHSYATSAGRAEGIGPGARTDGSGPGYENPPTRSGVSGWTAARRYHAACFVRGRPRRGNGCSPAPVSPTAGRRRRCAESAHGYALPVGVGRVATRASAPAARRPQRSGRRHCNSRPAPAREQKQSRRAQAAHARIWANPSARHPQGARLDASQSASQLDAVVREKSGSAGAVWHSAAGAQTTTLPRRG